MLVLKTSKISYTFRDYALFVGAFFLFFALLIFRVPTMSYQAEMYAEMGANYFYHAQYSDFFTNLTETDYGYLPFLTRMMALSGKWFGIPISLIPYYYGYLGLIIISLCCSSICLPQFRSVIQSDALRFLSGLAFALYRPYDLNTFLGCLYFGAIPYFLILATASQLINTSKIKLFALGLLLMLLGLSKALFISFAIPLVGLWIWSIRQRSTNFLFLIIPALIPFIIQVLVMIYAKASDGNLFAPSHQLSVIIYSFFTQFFTLLSIMATGGFLIFFYPYPPFVFSVLAVVMIVFLYGIFQSFRKKEFSFSWIPLLAIIVSASTVAICVMTMSLYQLSFGEFPKYKLLFTRHLFTAVVSLFFLLVYLIDKTSFRFQTKMAVLGCWIAVFPGFIIQQQLRQEPLVKWPTVGYSNWEAFAPILEAQNEPSDIFAPLNPYPWIYPWDKVRSEINGLGYIVSPPSIEEIQSFLNTKRWGFNDPLGYNVPSYISPKKVYYLALILNKDQIEVGINREVLVEAFDSEGKLLGVAYRLLPDRGVFSFFKFESPLSGIMNIRISSQPNLDSDPLQIGYQENSITPLWIWVGR